MGTTATSLHVLRASPDVDVARAIKSSYAKLGYGVSRQPKDKAVVVHGPPDSLFVSIHDSDNLLIDTGELKQLAVLLSKRLKSVVVLTSIYDSDSFEFIVFSAGKQVDAVVSDPDGHVADLKILKGARRLTTWKSLFLAPDLHRRLMSGAGLALDQEAFAKIMAEEQAFEARMKRVGTVEGAFAEAGLAACRAAAGLPPDAIDTTPDDADAPARSVLHFERQAPRGVDPAMAAPNPVGVKLRNFISNDDCPELRVYPAAWPFAEGAQTRADWLVVSSGAGFSGLRLTFVADDASAVPGRLLVRALPFYNGQITSSTPIASSEHALPSAISGSTWHFDIDPFVVPDLDPEARKEIVLVVALEVSTAGSQPITLHPVFAPAAAGAEALPLPSVKLQPTRPTWIPQVSVGRTTEAAPQIMRLNQPSVLSLVALLDETPACLAAVRTWSETWLGSLKVAETCRLGIATQKHMSASFRVAKNSKVLPFAAATSDKLWPKLFDAASDYQTVALEVMPQARAYPVAGLTVQAALRDGLRPDSDQHFAHLRDTVAPFLRPGDPPLHADRDAGAALCVALWVLNDPAIFAAIGVTADALTRQFEQWMARHAPIQAWVSRATWIPEFDLYEAYNQTLYERASTLDWFRSGLNGLLASRAWARRRLRFVAPTLWLGRDLAARVDAQSLAAVADVSPCGDATRLQLRADRGLADLEDALAPILPR